MNIDLQTQKELELFSYDSHGTSIFQLIDECSTPGGQYKLKQNFRSPSHQIKEIENIQTAVKYLLSLSQIWTLPVNTQLMDLLDVYYFSKSNPSIGKNNFARIIESISYRFMYKDFKATFIDGTRYVIHFLKLVAKFYDENYNQYLPETLRDIFLQVKEILELKPIQEPLNYRSVKAIPFHKLLKFDKIFRDRHKTEILKLIDLIYEIDVLISKAKSTQRLNLRFPEFIDAESGLFEMEGLFHLFVDRPVPNDIKTIPNQNFIFLTGPNMAGKTTFLKACGLAVFLAHLGMGVPAKKMKLSTFNHIFTSLNVSDNLPKGYSYFYSEVKRVKEAAMALRGSKKILIIFDELFKGTNIKDAFDGSYMIINELVKWKSGLFILSSHLLELGQKIKELPEVRFLCFDSKVEAGKPFFNYKLKEGLSDERLGLVILKNERIFELLNPDYQYEINGQE